MKLLPARPDVAIAIDEAAPCRLRTSLCLIEERALIDPVGLAAGDHDLAVDHDRVNVSHMGVVDYARYRVEQGRQPRIPAIEQDEVRLAARGEGADVAQT